MAAILEVHAIDKTFDRTHALSGAAFSVDSGEIHGLLGANGAGKSTLSKIISGHIVRDSGEILWRGAPLDHRSTREALNVGITMVMQETSLARDLTVVENIFLPELGRPGPLSYRDMRRRAIEVLAGLDMADSLPLDREVGSLSAAQRQLVEIAKALALESDLIIFDEPTTSLSPIEVVRLFDVMAKLRSQNRALVFVSHRLEEVFAITDRVTILREGRTVAQGVATAGLTQNELIRLMVGQEMGAVYDERPKLRSFTGEPALAVSHLAAAPMVRDVSFSVHPGEIVGLGGLVGAGRSETLEAIFGLRPHQGGEIRLAGRPFDPARPADAVAAGIGFVAEDRRVQGIVPDFTVRENLLLAHLGAHRGAGLGYGARRTGIDALLKRLDLHGDHLLDAGMLSFSGGMQQKIIIGRWLLLQPKVLLLDEPTKGVDIKTRAAIYAILQDIAAEGVGIVVVSSDFEELLGLCGRVVVVSDGATLAELPSGILDAEKLTLLAAPRTSMKRNSAMLRALAEEVGGACFWGLDDAGRLCCLEVVVVDPAADPGFRVGGTPRIEDCVIRTALATPSDDFVREPGGSRRTLVIPVHGHRGNDMGLIGVVLAGDGPTPSPEAIRTRVHTFFRSQS